jgi:hypothetical protein
VIAPSDPGSSTPRARLRRLTVLAATAVLALGACAGEASDDALTGGRSDGTDTEDTSGQAPGVPDDPEGTFDAAIAAARAARSAEVELVLEVDSSMGGGRAELTGDVDTDDVGRMVATAGVGMQATEFEFRSDGETVWITSDAPEITDELPPGVSWVEAPIGDLRDDEVWVGLDTTFDVLSVLRGADEVTDAGTGEVAGDEVRLLDVDVDWDAALAASDAQERAGLEDAITLTGDAQMNSLTVTVGLDGSGLVRLFELEAVAGPPGGSDLDSPFGSQEITLRMDILVRSFDHDVEVPEAPPSDETVALSDVPAVEAVLNEGM